MFPTGVEPMVELADAKEYPDKDALEYQALKRLGDRLRQEYDRHYGEN
jgi:hypothetical protein